MRKTCSGLRHIVRVAVIVAAASGVLTFSPIMADQGVIAAAAGSGRFLENGEFRVFSFNARTTANGVTKGQAQLRLGKILLHMELDCLAIDYNEAVMSGVVKSSNLGPLAPPGAPIVFYTKDQGEGGPDAPPDLLSLVEVFEQGESPTDCTQPLPDGLPVFPIVSGNIQVF